MLQIVFFFQSRLREINFKTEQNDVWNENVKELFVN